MDDDARAAASSLADQAKHPAYAPKPSKPHHKYWPILLAFIFFAVAAATVWFVVIKKDASTANSSNETTPANQVASVQKNTDVADASLTETYQSTALSVAFKHPSTWKVSEAGGGIRIESATFSFPSKYQGETSGNFRIYIRQGARKADGTHIGRGYAIKPSEKLVYTQPAVGQRSETLLSSFGYDTTDNFAFFMIAGNFQLSIGDTLGPDYGKEPDTYIITGGYAAPTAVDDLASIPVGLSYYQNTKAYRQALEILESLHLK